MPISTKQREAIYYQTPDGKEPVYDYIKKLKDPIGRAKIQTKIARAENGNFGEEGRGYRHISGDVWELKIDYGPGYRVYFLIDGDKLIVLLVAGSKKSQDADIKEAQLNSKAYKTEKG